MNNKDARSGSLAALRLASFCLTVMTLSGCSLRRGPVATDLPGGTPTPAIGAIPSATLAATATPPPTATLPPSGKIVYACQVFAQAQRDQICIMDADGTGIRRLTFDDYAENYYPSLSPQGDRVVYASNRTGNYEIYELDLESGVPIRLTDHLGEVGGPEISPDGTRLVFTNILAGLARIWMMNRDGSEAHEIFSRAGADSLDPTWSPDGTRILFASGIGNDKQLYTINPDGTDLRPVNPAFRTRGRSDWSPDGVWIASYAGSPWLWGIFLMNADGTSLHQVPAGGIVLAPAFSPDSQWIAFTGYLDNPGNPDGCEIYRMRLDGSQITRLTYNEYCDWQPRWGP